MCQAKNAFQWSGLTLSVNSATSLQPYILSHSRHQCRLGVEPATIELIEMPSRRPKPAIVASCILISPRLAMTLVHQFRGSAPASNGYGVAFSVGD